jgi:hypothetical protein
VAKRTDFSLHLQDPDDDVDGRYPAELSVREVLGAEDVVLVSHRLGAM